MGARKSIVIRSAFWAKHDLLRYFRMFTLVKETPLGRRGNIRTAHGIIETPFFMPVGTSGAMRGISHRELLELGAQILLCNTYHLSLRPGVHIVEEAGGLHAFIGWEKPILTDSGGYQVFSLRHRSTIDDRGVEFRDHLNGDLHFLGPEEAIQIQHKLGADIIMCFDECPPSKASHSDIERAVGRTLRWAKKCKEVHEQLCCASSAARRVMLSGANEDEARRRASAQHDTFLPLLFGIVQGGLDPALRKKCAEELIAIGFDGYALGGLAVGESPEEMESIVKEIAPLLPTNTPRYLMGVGDIEQMRRGVAYGMDMFDCVLPAREARHGRLFLSDGSEITITRNEFKNDHSIIDPDSPSELSREHTKSYLRHLFIAGERYAETIGMMQNLGVTLKMMQTLRKEMET